MQCVRVSCVMRVRVRVCVCPCVWIQIEVPVADTGLGSEVDPETGDPPASSGKCDAMRDAFRVDVSGMSPSRDFLPQAPLSRESSVKLGSHMYESFTGMTQVPVVNTNVTRRCGFVLHSFNDSLHPGRELTFQAHRDNNCHTSTIM